MNQFENIFFKTSVSALKGKESCSDF